MSVSAEAAVRPAAFPAVPTYVLYSVATTEFGALMIAATIGTPAPLLGMGLLMIALAALRLRLNDPVGRIAYRLRLKMFSLCALVAGVSHVYSTAVFGSNLQSSLEIPFFYDLSRYGFAAEMPSINAPYAVLTWRAAYETAATLGLGDGLWIGVAVNATVVALAASVVVYIVGMLFPDDTRRARTAARLVLWCAILWLFGGLFVRDSFALLLQTLVLATFVSLLRHRSVGRLLTHSFVLAILATLVAGIRVEMLATIPILVVLAAVSWALERRGLRRGILFIAVALISGAVWLMARERIAEVITRGQAGYQIMIDFTPGGDTGLGYWLVVSQPMPLRVLAGSVYMHLFPIPIWTGFNSSSWDYHWLKSFAGLFMILVTPLAAVGFYRSMERAWRGIRGSAPQTFVALYWPVMVAAVAATSLETRHVGQFVLAFIVLAVVPSFHDFDDRRAIYIVALLWYSAVLFGHILWMVVH
jgi:hypothetical protein